MTSETIILQPGIPSQATEAASLIYASVHELMHFMFPTQAIAEQVLAKLYTKQSGHFSHRFTTIALEGGKVVGLELGYDRQQLAKQDLPGSIAMLLSSPVSVWWHLLVETNSVLDGYIVKPSAGVYYINNIAVSPASRGGGIGRVLLLKTIERAKQQGYSGVELDVTSINGGAIQFYQKHGFVKTYESGSVALQQKYALPPLIRMLHKF